MGDIRKTKIMKFKAVQRFTIIKDIATGKLIPVPVTEKRFVKKINGTSGMYISIAEPLPEGFEET